MYVYFTPDFTNKVNRHHIQHHISQLRQALEINGKLAIASRFTWVYPYLKHKIGNLRAIAKIDCVNQKYVICLLDIVRRGDSQYEKFLNNPNKYGQQYLEPLVNKSRKHLINSILQQQQSGKIIETEQLPSEFYSWLQPPGLGQDRKDWVVYESDIWVKKFKQSETKTYWNDYHEIVDFLISGTTDKPDRLQKQTTSCDRIKICSNNKTGKSVLFAQFNIAVPSDRKVLFLLSPFSHQLSTQELEELIDSDKLLKFIKSKTLSEQSITLDELSSYARRSYPGYLLADKGIWHDIESEDGTNHALSAEEEQILHQISSPGADNKSLPVFINGRAGSGKSLMLFYLFADYCYRFQTESAPQDAHPLFLTYNEKLLEKAKEEVRKLLSVHHKYVLDESRDRPSIDNCFQSFQKFLLSLLPPSELERFDPDKYLSFHRFRKLYETRFHNYSPELCWHIIRTFIKGYQVSENVNDYMTPEDYKEVPRNEHTIPDEVFSDIYCNIWSWYKNLSADKGYWDDQDLIRTVLRLKCYRHSYTVIFCDEAQDFTRIELQLILQLSVWVKYELYPPVQSLPFAFAGDPFQTLNPTGFRWESLRAAFFDRIISVLDPSHRLNIEMNFQELERNYRSHSSIVKFTNLIHLWRHILFQIRDLRPQLPWKEWETSAIEPQKFIFDRDITVTQLKTNLQNAPIFILPCEARGEVEYIQNDPILQELFPEVQREGKLPKNVLSAVEAKGLEFSLTILYKFGDFFANEYQVSAIDLIENRPKEDLLEFEYFFNKLYVAASRAMSDLIIVDSEAGDRYLWQYATSDRFNGNGDSNGAAQWVEKADDPSIWQSYVATLYRGDNLGVINQDNRESQAREFRQNGISQQNPDLLRRAAEFYREIGATDKAQDCEAWQFKFDKQWHEAGQLFDRLGQPNEAWDCFWQGLCWSDLQQWYNNYSSHHEVLPIVEFVTRETIDLDSIWAFTDFLEESDCHQLLYKNRTSKPWQVAIDRYGDRLDGFIESEELEPHQLLRFGNIFNDLANAGYRYNKMLDRAGQCFYQLPEYDRAVSCWQKAKQTDRNEYHLAKAYQSGFPKGFPDLEKVQAYDRIVEEWEKSGRCGNKTWIQYSDSIVRALEYQNRYTDGFEYLVQIRAWTKAIKLLNALENRESWQSEARNLQFELVRQFARFPDLNPETARQERQKYVSFINKVWSLPDSAWQQYLSMPEIGTALEKIGDFVPTLSFYENFLDRGDRRISRLARERWLATKLKQKDYASGTDPSRASKISEDINRKARKWRINLQQISLEPLSGEELDRWLQKLKEPVANEAPQSPDGHSIQGLPSGVRVNTIAPGIQQFNVGDLQVTLIQKPRQVIINHERLSKQITVAIQSGECTLQGSLEKVNIFDRNHASFNSDSGYTGIVYYNQPSPHLELNLSEPSIHLRIPL